MKHEGKKKVEKDTPQLGVNAKEWYNNKTCIHKRTKLCFLPNHLLLFYKSIRIFIFNLTTCCFTSVATQLIKELNNCFPQCALFDAMGIMYPQ
jgi:hypothetical protein